MFTAWHSLCRLIPYPEANNNTGKFSGSLRQPNSKVKNPLLPHHLQQPVFGLGLEISWKQLISHRLIPQQFQKDPTHPGGISYAFSVRNGGVLSIPALTPP